MIPAVAQLVLFAVELAEFLAGKARVLVTRAVTTVMGRDIDLAEQTCAHGCDCFWCATSEPGSDCHGDCHCSAPTGEQLSASPPRMADHVAGVLELHRIVEGKTVPLSPAERQRIIDWFGAAGVWFLCRGCGYSAPTQKQMDMHQAELIDDLYAANARIAEQLGDKS